MPGIALILIGVLLLLFSPRLAGVILVVVGAAQINPAVWAWLVQAVQWLISQLPI